MSKIVPLVIPKTDETRKHRVLLVGVVSRTAISVSAGLRPRSETKLRFAATFDQDYGVNSPYLADRLGSGLPEVSRSRYFGLKIEVWSKCD
jgi:hypothetical protein